MALTEAPLSNNAYVGRVRPSQINKTEIIGRQTDLLSYAGRSHTVALPKCNKVWWLFLPHLSQLSESIEQSLAMCSLLKHLWQWPPVRTIFSLFSAVAAWKAGQLFKSCSTALLQCLHDHAPVAAVGAAVVVWGVFDAACGAFAAADALGVCC